MSCRRCREVTLGPPYVSRRQSIVVISSYRERWAVIEIRCGAWLVPKDLTLLRLGIFSHLDCVQQNTEQGNGVTVAEIAVL